MERQQAEKASNCLIYALMSIKLMELSIANFATKQRMILIGRNKLGFTKTGWLAAKPSIWVGYQYE